MSFFSFLCANFYVMTDLPLKCILNVRQHLCMHSINKTITLIIIKKLWVKFLCKYSSNNLLSSLLSYKINCKYALLNLVLQHISISCTIKQDVDMYADICIETSLYKICFYFKLMDNDEYEDTKESLILVFCQQVSTP